MASRFSRNGNGNGGGSRTAEKKDPPVYSRRFYMGASGTIEVCVWLSPGDGNSKRDSYFVTTSRSYKDGDDYKKADTFWPQDLAMLATLLNDAALWISEQDAKR
jgi:hypothetical protein